MTPRELIQKWAASSLRERAGSQEHFIDVCRMLGEPTPADVDPDGSWYTFDRGAKKTGGGEGWADVWKRGCFGWEYKGKHKDLDGAYAQLQRYAVALENPPLLVVSDMEKFVIHTNFTNTIHNEHRISLFDLEKEESRHLLKTAFSNPDELKPGKTREWVTQEAAAELTKLAFKLREAKGHDAHVVAHFLNKILFCLFAEDIGILPNQVFTKLLEASLKNPARFRSMAVGLFSAMSGGGDFGPEIIDWFNGGLFDDNLALPLDRDDIRLLIGLAEKDWSAIEPSIFGTLFERGLDPDKRSQLGAHYTDRKSIERIVFPVVLDPLAQEWQQGYERIKVLQEKALKQDIVARTARLPKERTAAKKSATEAFKEADTVYRAFLARLASMRVLDPACGSGNFLYVALQGLHDLEHRAMIEAESLGLHIQFPQVGPEAVAGIEKNPYAAELSRVTIWIGEIQWMLDHGYSLGRNPVLRKLDQIACRDALLNEDGTEAEWPAADVIIGNPPYVGGNRIRQELGDEYVNSLFRIYQGRLSAFSDLVCYWFERARTMIASNMAKRAGLLATQSIRGGVNRSVLERIKASGDIFMAWSDEPWLLDGATVHVALVGFDNGSEQIRTLDGERVDSIYADLTHSVDVTKAGKLQENARLWAYGSQQKGSFDVPAELGSRLLSAKNPLDRDNSEVVRPGINGKQLLQRHGETWVIDFGETMPVSEAAMYEAPFKYVKEVVYKERQGRTERRQQTHWWLHARPSPKYRRMLRNQERYIATPVVSKHRVFVWLGSRVVIDHAIVAFARSDDYFFGVLHSNVHELWARRKGTQVRDAASGFRYTPSTTFDTFPMPWSPGKEPNGAEIERISEAAKELVEKRNSWLNPRNASTDELKDRTLTNLYNNNPQWLQDVHGKLNRAVLSAYGWPHDISDEAILQRLLDLNHQRASYC